MVISQDYVELLKKILSDGFNPVKFFKNTGFTFAEKDKAETTLHNALEIIASEKDKQANRARNFLTMMKVSIPDLHDAFGMAYVSKKRSLLQKLHNAF
jgi:hypothetical protein